jgi:hypothetical protein
MRFMGSLAFVASAHSAYLVVEEKTDDGQNTAAVLEAKTNIGPKQRDRGLAYRLLRLRSSRASPPHMFIGIRGSSPSLPIKHPQRRLAPSPASRRRMRLPSSCAACSPMGRWQLRISKLRHRTPAFHGPRSVAQKTNSRLSPRKPVWRQDDSGNCLNVPKVLTKVPQMPTHTYRV